MSIQRSNKLIEKNTKGNYDNTIPHPIIMIGQVKDVTDNNDARRVKVRIKGMDDNKGDDGLPTCAPAIPLIINMNPKAGEAVIVIIPDSSKPNSNRMWLGPIISQYQNVEKDPFNNSATNTLSYGTEQLQVGYTQRVETRDLYPSRDEIGIVGRGVADIRIGNDFVEIVNGKKDPSNPQVFNTDNLATVTTYLVKDRNQQTGGTTQTSGFKTVNSMQSNYNILVSHESRDKLKPKLRNLDFEDVLEGTEPMVYGDKLVELLDLMRKVLLNHVHPYSGVELDPVQNVNRLSEYDLGSVLSDFNRLG